MRKHWVHRCHIIQECYQRCPGISIRKWGWGKGGTEVGQRIDTCVPVYVCRAHCQDNSTTKHRVRPSKSLLNVKESCFLKGETGRERHKTTGRHHTDITQTAIQTNRMVSPSDH